LVVPLRASGAKEAILTDLEAACRGLDLFKTHGLKDFADFLVRAEEFDRTGKVAVNAKATRIPASRASKPPKMSVDDALQAIRSLYDRAGSDEVNESIIKAEVGKLGGLSRTDLIAVSQQFGLGKTGNMEVLIAAIEKKILSRRGSHHRLQAIHD